MGQSVEAQLTAILSEYSEECADAVNDAAKESSNKIKKRLRATSPRRKKRGGKYASGWTVKNTSTGILVGYTVYNKDRPGLTHLLEHGHVAENQYGAHGRTPAMPHIKPAEQEGIREFERLVREKIGEL